MSVVDDNALRELINTTHRDAGRKSMISISVEIFLPILEELQGRRSTYAIPEVLAYLRERAEWLQREIDGGGDREHLSTRRAECLYAAKCIDDTARRLASVAGSRLECTAGCERPICEKFEQQDDGEGRVDTYCARCGHTDECHQPVKTP